jgi:hypothetical protein
VQLYLSNKVLYLILVMYICVGAISYSMNLLPKFTLMIKTLLSGGKMFARLNRVIISFNCKYGFQSIFQDGCIHCILPILKPFEID